MGREIAIKMDMGEKAIAFDKIAECFYKQNFGQMSKADLEVLLFSVYIEFCLEHNLKYDDYTLAVQLGIPESKVRLLKVKKQLQYPYEKYQWKKAFLDCISHAVYDEKKALVKVSINDPNVRRDVEAYIDDLNIYSEYQLNRKLLQMRADHFVLLCMSLYSECMEGKELKDDVARQIQNKLLKSVKNGQLKEESIIERIRREGLENCWKDVLKEGSKEALKLCIKFIPFEDYAKDKFRELVESWGE